jgi:hypothetical protein
MKGLKGDERDNKTETEAETEGKQEENGRLDVMIDERHEWPLACIYHFSNGTGVKGSPFLPHLTD